MKFKNWKQLVEKMIEVYGVRSYFDNEPEEDDVWFECAECGEPILQADWRLKEVAEKCPVCEYRWEFD